MESIRNYGFNPGHKPIVMATTPGCARVIDGMHRVHACQRLLASDWQDKETIRKIPCIVLKKNEVDAVTEKLIAQSKFTHAHTHTHHHHHHHHHL